MAFQPGLRTINRLLADQQVASSVVPVNVQNSATDFFGISLPAGARLSWKLEGIFTLGATGGFRFLAHSTAAPATYNFNCEVRDLVTPATITPATGGVLTETAFANASAVAGNYQLRASGIIVANAATVFSFQFAQNTADVLPIIMRAGMRIELTQF